MPKILSDKAYGELKAKSENYDALVNGIVTSNEGMTTEEVTPEFIQSAMAGATVDTASADKVTELESQLATLTTERETLTSEKETLTSEKETLTSEKQGLETEKQDLTEQLEKVTTEVDELKVQNAELSKLPGAKSIASGTPAAELTADGVDEMLAFATEHKGDTMAIAAKMQELGLA